jgi:molybdate transport system regulatory protein
VSDKLVVDYTLNLKLRKTKPFFGPGVVELLQRIKRTGSLNTAAKEMKMSYNKAWRIIHYAEKELGYPLIIRNVGGSNGGGSKVTSDGEQMITKFLLFQKKTYQATNQYFEEIFGEDFLS